MKRLDEKVALITGAASGLGYSITEKFIHEGAKVVAVDLSDNVHELKEEFGDNIAPVEADVSAEEDIQTAIDKGIKEFGKIDILLNNAGIGGSQEKTHEISGEDLKQTFEVNFMGPFYGIKNIIPHFLENGEGVILNTASLAAYPKNLSGTPYSSSKAAVKKLTEVVAYEYAGDNIRVNAIAPGSIETPIYEGQEELKEELAATLPTQRLGQPKEGANVAAFLVSEEASFVTGQTVIADGGQQLT